MIKKYLIICILLLLPFSTAWAVKVSGLYEVDIPVSGQSLKERESVMAEALRQALVKVSGNAAIGSLPSIANALPQADSLLQQYSYSQQQREEGPQWILHIAFTPSGVVKLLHLARQGVWGVERPLLVAWIVLDDASKRQTLSDVNLPELAVYLRRAADQRGLPVNLPMLDLQDLSSVSNQDLWQANGKPLLKASQRYHASGAVLGKITRRAQDQWVGQWYLWVQNEKMVWQVTAESREAVISKGLDNITEALASRYAVLDSASTYNVMMLTVNGVKSVADYAKVFHFLHSLAPVKSLQVVTVDNDRVQYKIALLSNREAFMQAMNLHELLVPSVNTNLDIDTGLSYRFIS